MALLIEALRAPPAIDGVRLEPLGEAHRAALKAACAEDPAIWAIYPVSYAPDRFDASFDRLVAAPDRLPFAVYDLARSDGVARGGGDDATFAGMTAYLGADAERALVEIGNSYLRPALRGTGLNRRLKRLMIGHAFACGARRIEFRVDDRNARSKAAVAAIGGVFEGLMRADRVTWTGHVRDTALFSILRGEWGE